MFKKLAVPVLFLSMGVLWAAMFLTGCGGRSGSRTGGSGDVGTLSLSLVATTNGHTYRLRQGSFVITGSQSIVLDSEVDPGAVALTALLGTGDYVALLSGSWFLERLDPGGFVPVNATLTSPNPVTFRISAGATTSVPFRFATNGIIVVIGTGTVSITTEVTEIGDGVATCGDGVVTGTEQCDGSALGSQSCASRGFGGGSLACRSSCTFDFSGCTVRCVAPDQTAGDCRTQTCDANGNVSSVSDDTDVPADDGEQCTTERCVAGTPVHEPATVGASCDQNGGSVCNGEGACVGQCIPAQCPGQDNDCQAPTCTNSECGIQFEPSGFPCMTGTAPGVCNGSGVCH
jgi:hypothetical protein